MPNDPFADAMNTSGYAGLIGPNPYLEYTGKFRWRASGAPDRRHGQSDRQFQPGPTAHDAWAAANPAPAAPAQGTTLNSTPQHGAVQHAPWQWDALRSADGNAANHGATCAGATEQARLRRRNRAQGPAPAPQNPIDMRQAYLDALSNPGKVTTPGAQMLPGTSPTGPQSQPSVLAQFLQQHPGGGTTGAGGYSNQGFFNTLNALKQGATT